MALRGIDTRHRNRRSFVQGEPSPALDRQLNADHDCPMDIRTHSHAPGRADLVRIERMRAFGQDRAKNEEENVNPPRGGGGAEIRHACQVGVTDLLEVPATPLQEITGTPGGVLHKKPHNGVRIGCRVGHHYESTIAQLAQPGKSGP